MNGKEGVAGSGPAEGFTRTACTRRTFVQASGAHDEAPVASGYSAGTTLVARFADDVLGRALAGRVELLEHARVVAQARRRRHVDLLSERLVSERCVDLKLIEDLEVQGIHAQ